MRPGATFIRSKLSRRIIALFVLCALIPVTLLAALSFWSVNTQLREQDREALRAASHEQGMRAYERLTLIEAHLKLVALDPEITAAHPELDADPLGLEQQLTGLDLLPPSGAPKPLFGTVSAQPDLSPDDRAWLNSGKTLILTRTCQSARTCVLMLRQAGSKTASAGLLVAEVSPLFLLPPEGASENLSGCILDEQDALLVCSSGSPPPFAASALRNFSGRFSWSRDAQQYESDYWRIFLKPNFHADHWTVIATESTGGILGPITRFKKLFVLALLLGLWTVIFLSMTEVRRTLIPLGELQQATRRVAEGQFQSRVNILSRDEFEELGKSFNSMAGRIEKQFNTLRAKNAIDRAILSSWEIEKIVGALLSQLRSSFSCDLAAVTVLGARSSGRIRSYLIAQGKPDEEDCWITQEDTKAEMTCAEPRLIAETDPRPQFLAPLASRGMKSFLVAPVIVKTELAAIISLATAQSHDWTKDDLSHAGQIADQAGVALSNARLVADLKDMNLGTLTALARAIDAKSHWTAGHSERVTATALKIAEEMKLPARDLEILHRGGLLHDIGKIGVPAVILDKPGKLTHEESAAIRDHVEIGRRILEPIRAFAECMPVVLEHHEWVDGSGYPKGLRGDQISIHARIFAVADCYDALISERPYRAGIPLDRVLEMLQDGVGKQFDARVMDAFLRVIAREQMGAVEKISAQAAVPAPAVVH